MSSDKQQPLPPPPSELEDDLVHNREMRLRRRAAAARSSSLSLSSLHSVNEAERRKLLDFGEISAMGDDIQGWIAYDGNFSNIGTLPLTGDRSLWIMLYSLGD